MGPRPEFELRVASIALLFVGWLAACAPPPPSDLVVITVDTLRADHLGCYGRSGARTPHLDRLAEQGALFTRALTPLPRTTPALASIFTGLSPVAHGSREVHDAILPDLPLVSELLAAAGYATRAGGATPAGGRETGLDRGYEVFLGPDELGSVGAAQVSRQALELVGEAPGDRPLLLWVHFFDPHAPYDPPPGWEPGEDGEACRQAAREARERGWASGHLFRDRDGFSRAVLESCSALYGAEISYVDHEIGLLLEGFSERRPGSEPVVVVTSDHGENLGEEGLYYQHGPSLHDASARVPLIVAGEGLSPRRDGELASLEDLAPTLLALAGVDPPPMDGIDLGPRLRGEETPARELHLAEAGSALLTHNFLFLHSGRAWGLHCLNGTRFSLCRDGEEPARLFDRESDPELSSDVSELYPEVRERLLEARRRWPAERARHRAARDARFKLVERPRLEGGYQRALYDLEKDPMELQDVGELHPDVMARLGRELDRWGRELDRWQPRRRSPEALEQLRALGYID